MIGMRSDFTTVARRRFPPFRASRPPDRRAPTQTNPLIRRGPPHPAIAEVSTVTVGSAPPPILFSGVIRESQVGRTMTAGVLPQLPANAVMSRR